MVPVAVAVVIVSGVFSSTDTVLTPELATTRSGLPSPLRSANATEKGQTRWRRSAGRRRRAWSRPAPSCSAAPTRVVACVGDDEVGLAVAVDVRRPPRSESRPRWRRSAGGRRRAWSRPAPSCSAAPTPCWRLRWRRARSGLPSPLTSATATEAGNRPGGEGLLGGEGRRGRARRRRVQQHRHRCRQSSWRRARSGLPSPLRSAIATESGQIPRRRSAGGRRTAWSRPASSCSAAPTPCWSCSWRRRGRACRRR